MAFMQAILRALTPPTGRIYRVRPRTLIGRAAAADIQLLHDAVSRHHALIELETTGRHVLTDLASGAGTRLDGERIVQARLSIGAVIDVCGHRLRFEVTPEAPIEDPPPNVRSERTKRATITDVAARLDQSTVAPDSRASRRLGIESPVTIAVLRGSNAVTITGELLDASATGAKLRTTDVLPIGGLCWVLAANHDDACRSVALAARVVSRDPELGIFGVAFVGTPPTDAAALRRGE